MDKKISFSVFTKPWPKLEVEQLAEFISNLGFDGIEFPLRPGYQVEPQNAEKKLPGLVELMRKYKISVTSVASGTDENIFSACALAGVPVIRIMGNIDLNLGYKKSEDDLKKQIDSLLPLCEKYKIKIGVQHHYGPMISNSMELYSLISGFDPKYVGGIWDSAHSALAGEVPEQGLDILWDNLCMVNFKNAYYKRKTGPEAEDVEWTYHFTSGRQGLASWPRISRYLLKRGYEGVICLTAEYSDEDQVNRLIAEDIKYTKSLF